MANLDLTKYGITGATEIIHNPSFDFLYAEETKPELTGFDKGQVSELGAVNVMTGIYTGRSPNDKFIVMDENSKDTVWWTSPEYKNDNHVASIETWNACKEIAKKELSGKRLFVVDAFCGTNEDTRMAVRFIMEVAWQAHFVKNMFIQPTEAELRALSLTSWSTTPPRRRSRTTRSWVSTPRPRCSSTSPPARRPSSTPGTAAR